MSIVPRRCCRASEHSPQKLLDFEKEKRNEIWRKKLLDSPPPPQSPHPPPPPPSPLPLSLLLLLCHILRIRLRALRIRLRHKAPIPTLFFSVTEPQSQHSHHRRFLLRHLNRHFLRRFSSSSAAPSASATAMPVFSSSRRIHRRLSTPLSRTTLPPPPTARYASPSSSSRALYGNGGRSGAGSGVVWFSCGRFVGVRKKRQWNGGREEMINESEIRSRVLNTITSGRPLTEA
ncbi:uncharacterized protein HKW66_Vig0237810 [Vigna angularis]|uniref:Uncharacterized protein n=1 Tax=Phaseolus angularis TaxID=3914 RepID=A0A8T0KSA7_PHAAN|nr:uncharacterized protein HKW66_Vig0237810 [Vigna angularis]